MTGFSSGQPATPRDAFAEAERALSAHRTRAPDPAGAIAAALALVDPACPREFHATGAAIAAAIEAHAASFAPLPEPAYHNRQHQAEAVRAMGWLCAAAARRGLLDAATARAGVLAMAGHDLEHDGARHAPGFLEAHSASRSVAMAAAAGLADDVQAVLRRVILATNTLRPAAQAAADDLLCRIAQEADIFASLTPELGWHLSAALGQELRAAGITPTPPVESFAGRLAWLRARPPATPAGEVLGLAEGVADQIDAFARLGNGDAEAGAAWLDSQPRVAARALYAATRARARLP